MSRFFMFGGKKLDYYKGILIKADMGLHEQIAGKVQELLPHGRILDLGAGVGALSQRLIDLGYEVVAADMEAADFACKQAKFHTVNFDKADEVRAFAETYRESFDMVLGIEVIEHVENPWEYVRLLKSMLKPGGHLMVTTPNTTSWLSRLQFLFTGRFHQFADEDLSYGHIAPVSSWELSLILKSENFQQVQVTCAGTLPKIWLVRSKKVLFFNMLSWLLRPFLRGAVDGWCIMAVAKKGAAAIEAPMKKAG
jgi:2-polyprenyl-3-methyl-5-hydroxy-6-metoxy-1,4-benzoquinol methylase